MTAHSVALQSSSWEKSPLFYAKSERFFPVIPEAVIIHSHKRIFFRQSNDGFLHLCKVLGRQKPSHDEEEPEEMGIIHCAIFPADQQRLFFFVEGRLLLKETIVNAAPVCAKIADDRHAVHILPQNFWAAIHSKPEPMGNCFFERTFGNGIQERNVGDRQQINVGPERNLLVQVVDEVL